jgi:plastocyanin
MRRAPLVSMLLALALALVSCGDDDTTGSSGTITLTGGQPLDLEAFEYGFKPGTITVRAGGESAHLRIVMSNTGSLPHDAHVREGDEELGGTKAVGGGESAEATVDLAPGDYELYCSIGDHADLGMIADLKIE